MSLKDVIYEILGKPKEICEWKEPAEQERVIAFLDNYDIRRSEYYKMGCYYCDGKREECQYSLKQYNNNN